MKFKISVCFYLSLYVSVPKIVSIRRSGVQTFGLEYFAG